MASYKHSQYTRCDRHDQLRDQIYLDTSNSHKYSQSRYPDLEEPQPRRQRWAAGYIDRHSCPSYAYIETRSRSPNVEDLSDTEYIEPQRLYANDDYIQPKGHHGEHRDEERHPPRLQTDQRCIYMRGKETKSEYGGSDIEDLSGRVPHHHHHYHTDRSSTRSISSTRGGSDIIHTARTLGSDVASVPQSRRPSLDSTGSRPITNYQRRTDSSASDSDSDGGYISLDDYIGGGSDYVTGPLLSDEDDDEDGEGSDAVGSDFEVLSDVGEGSDVASFSDDAGSDDDEGEDCIGDQRYRYWSSRG